MYMKKVVLFVVFLSIAFSTFSQQTNPSPSLTKQDYLNKSKKQKTVAWILTGVEPYLGATEGCGWSDQEYEEWLTALLQEQLLDP